MTKRHAGLVVFAAVFALCGCDGLSKIQNDSMDKLVVRYWHTNYNRWSPQMRAGSNQTIHIPPGHNFGDVSCLEIVTETHRFVYDNAVLRDVQTLCRKTNTCTIRYLGEGRLSVSGDGGPNSKKPGPLPADKRCRA